MSNTYESYLSRKSSAGGSNKNAGVVSTGGSTFDSYQARKAQITAPQVSKPVSTPSPTIQATPTVTPGATPIIQKKKTPFQEGIDRIKATPLKEFFLPTSTAFKFYVDKTIDAVKTGREAMNKILTDVSEHGLVTSVGGDIPETPNGYVAYNGEVTTYEKAKASYPEKKQTTGEKISQDIGIAMAQLMQGYTGGILKSNYQPKELDEKIVSGVSNVLGSVTSLKRIGGIFTKLALGNETVATLIKTYPKISKIAVPLLKNVVSFDIYGQLDPDQRDRLQKLGTDTLLGTLFTPLGFIKQAKFSVPLSFGTGFGLAKLSGASDEDAFIMGGILAGLDVTGRASRYLFEQKVITKGGNYVMSPDEAIDVVMSSSLKDTETGRAILKTALEARSSGKNVEVVTGKATKTTGAKQILNIKSPTIGITGVRVVDVPATVGGTQPTTGTEIVKTGTEIVPAGGTQPSGVETPITAGVAGQGITVFRGAKDQTIDVNRANGITGGVSMSEDKAVAERFAKKEGGTVQQYTISPDAVIVNHSDLEKLTKEEVAKYLTDNKVDVVRFDVPAGAKGETELRIINPKVLQSVTEGQGANIKAVTPKKGEIVQPKPTQVASTDELLKYVDRMGDRTPEQLSKLRADIEANGIKYPVELIIKEDGTWEINDGNHRVLIAKDLGIKDIPIKIVENRQKPQITAKKPVSPTPEKVSPVKAKISGKGRTLTLAPSKAVKPKDVLSEVAKLGLPHTVIKKNIYSPKTGLHDEVVGYARPKIGRIEFQTFVKNSPEFKANPVMEVTKDMELAFEGKNVHFTIKPEAMNISIENLKPGDKIELDINRLTGKESHQMRVRNRSGEILGFNPKNLEDPFSPKAEAELKKVVKQSEIAKRLSEKLNVPIRRGKFRARGALGIYKGKQKIVRIKSGGLNTIFHEVGHYLDDTIGLSKNIDLTERKALMSEYGYSYEGQPGKQRKEAFAEYLRYRLTGQDEKIAKYAPKFDKVFNEQINGLPEIKEVLDIAREDYSRWASQPATAKILSQLSIGKQPGRSFKENITYNLHNLYTQGMDDLHPLSEFAELGKKKVTKLEAERDPYILARNLRGWVGKAELFLDKGTFGKKFWKTDEKTGKTVMDFNGKSYTEIMKPVEEAGVMDDFRVYIVSQRIVNDLAPRGIKTGISPKDAQVALDELNKKHPEFEKIAQERRDYKDRLLEFAQQNGLIGEEGLAKIKELNKFHVPFYRVMEESTVQFLGKSKFAGNVPNPIKKIKGSEREIIDPIESDIKDTYAIINASERNNIGVAMANLANEDFELGRLFEKVDKPMKPVTVNVKEVLSQALKGSGLETSDIPEGLADLVVTLFRPMQDRGQNMLNVNFGDKQEVFQVDPDLFKAIQGLNAEDVSLILKIMSIPAKLLRAGATLTPDFSVRNPLRDQFTAFVYSKYGFIPGIDLVKGMFELFKKGDVYDLWKAGGGEHSMFVSLDREVLQKNYKDLMRSKGSMAFDYVKNPLKSLQLLSEFGEAGTRLGEMRKGLERGASPIESAFASRDVTLDFSRIGAKTKAWNAITAFFNANLQGTDKMIRQFKTHPFRTLLKVLLGITLPSILLYFANRKDPRWKEIPAWQKDLFWIVFTPKHIIRIPKPFELGILFGSVPERILEYIDTQDPYIFKELESSIVNGFSPGILPTGLIPIIENITNYSFFLERPIVSQGMGNLPPAKQANTYTSETAKVIGETLNYSPAKIDNLIQGYTGGLGKYGVSGLDMILKGTNVVNTPTAPSLNLEDMPVIKAFMIRPPVGSGSESVNRVYDLYAIAEPERAYANKLVKDGRTVEAEDYVKKHPEILTAKILGSATTDFSDMNKAITGIRNSRELSSDEKREKIQAIQTLQTELAQKTLQYLKDNGL